MAESVGAFEFYLQETLKDLSENGKQIDLKLEQGTAIMSLVHGQDVLAILPTGFDVNKIDRPNKTPTIRAICTFAVYFSVFRPFCCFDLVYVGHFVLCYKEKVEPLDRAKVIGLHDFRCYLCVASLSLTPL